MILRVLLLIFGAAAAGVMRFVDLDKIPLEARLSLFAFFDLVAIIAIGVLLAPHCRTRPTSSIGIPGPPLGQPKRVGGAIILLLLGSLLGIFALRWGTVYHVIMYGPPARDSTMIVVTAGRPLAEQVVIQYPPSPLVCHPFDPDPSRTATVSQENPDGPDPKILIMNFQYPQLAGLQCLPHLRIDNIKLFVDPPLVRALRTTDVHTIRLYLTVGGILLWLLTSAFFALSCRPY